MPQFDIAPATSVRPNPKVRFPKPLTILRLAILQTEIDPLKFGTDSVSASQKCRIQKTPSTSATNYKIS